MERKEREEKVDGKGRGRGEEREGHSGMEGGRRGVSLYAFVFPQNDTRACRIVNKPL